MMELSLSAVSQKLSDIFEEMSFGEKNVDISLAKEWIRGHETLDCWIDGKFHKPSGSSIIYHSFVYEPREKNEVQILEGVECTDAAVSSSIQAQLNWEKESSHVRSDLLYKISNAIHSRAELFYQLNYGFLQKNDFQLFTEYFNLYSGSQVYEDLKPVGVVLIILSLETPLWILGMSVAAALSTGCTVIVKPSSKAPFFSFLLAEICTQVGLPNGILNVVPGSKITSEKLIYNDDIKKVVFNGDDLIASSIYVKVPEKHFSFLNMNHTASIVLESCDVQGAVDKLFTETWNSNYQNMWSVDVIVVQESIFHIFFEKISYKIENFTYEGHAPLKYRNQVILQRMSEVLLEAKRMGIKVVECSASGDTWGPALIVEHQSDFSHLNLPIITVMVCRTAKEGITMINNLSYCLAASIWTENWSQALEVGLSLYTNIIWVNCHGMLETRVPLEPLRKSGVGSFGGVYGVLNFVTSKEGDETLQCSQEYEKYWRDMTYEPEKLFSFDVIQTASNGFASWKCAKNKKQLLMKIYYSMKNNEILNEFSNIVLHWAHSTHTFSITRSQDDLPAMEFKVPLGIIGILLMNEENIIEAFVFLVSLAISTGNVVVIMVLDNGIHRLKETIDSFTKNLPKGVVNVIKGFTCLLYIASHPNLEAFWLYGASSLTSSALLRKIKTISTKNLKRFWVIPHGIPQYSVSSSFQCLRRKTIFCTKKNQYP